MTITSLSDTYLSDLGNTIKVSISASRFAAILAKSDPDLISVEKLVNLNVGDDSPKVKVGSTTGLNAFFEKDFKDAYDGSK